MPLCTPGTNINGTDTLCNYFYNVPSVQMEKLMTPFCFEFAKRLNQALDEAGIPQHGKSTILAKEIGVGVKAANKWINGETLPTVEKIVDIALFLKKSVSWLITGIDDDNDSRPDKEIAISRLAMARYAPVLSWVQAGVWTDMDSVVLSGDEEVLPLTPYAGKNSFYLTVKGESNFPEFEDGEKICIDPDFCLSDIQNGEMIVVRWDNKATFKALVVESDKLFLKALNPDWHPKIIEIPEGAVLVGKYAGSFIPPRRF
ncbi:LexA family protein [Acinetobacter haemolyticus]|uniref:LexA family protein n=2 Tax=Moraxellaceae TaxID=468 RepID=UPI0012BC6BA9|nr:S24 family peptidase [Acinetobacter haemolyticus]